MNTVLVKSSLPHGLPDFEALRVEDFPAAFEQVFANTRLRIDEIRSQERTATFENTIEALEAALAELWRVERLFSNLLAAASTAELRNMAGPFQLAKTQLLDDIYLDQTLFERVRSVAEIYVELEPQCRQLLLRTLERFEVAGAALSSTDREQLSRLNAQLASQKTEFSNRLLAATDAGGVEFSSADELSGLAPSDLAAAYRSAGRGLPDRYEVAQSNFTVHPFLAALDSATSRDRLFSASVSKGKGGVHDTTETLARIVQLRAERARLLGYESHAARVAARQTIGSLKRMDEVFDPMISQAAHSLRAAADRLEEHAGEPITAVNWAFHAEKRKQEHLQFSASELRPYFEYLNVLHKGVFFAAERLYGLTFASREDLAGYHQDVRVYEVFDADGSTLGLFCHDVYQRAGKQGGAWMNAFEWPRAGHTGVITNNLNVPRPPAGKPTLLTLAQVKTMFHEFGHALHGFFSNTRYESAAGTQVPRDFVEYPSQVNEMWLTEVLENYAVHYETGEKLPAELAQKLRDSASWNVEFEFFEVLAAAMLDQAWHRLSPGDETDVDGIERRIANEFGVPFDLAGPRYRSSYFRHVFSGGYDAAYYSYLWSEILAAQTEQWFRDQGGLVRSAGDRFREEVLSRGRSREPLESFRALLGHEPDPKYLLVRRGLAAGGEG